MTRAKQFREKAARYRHAASEARQLHRLIASIAKSCLEKARSRNVRFALSNGADEGAIRARLNACVAMIEIALL